MTDTPTHEELEERARRLFPGRTLPPGFYADFPALDEVEMRGLVDASIMSTADRLTSILEDESLDDADAIDRMIDHVVDYLRLVALGCVVFPSDGVGRVVRVDSPGPTPEEEAAIERRLAAIRPVILDALDAVMGEE
ncbi:MAG: hypothetical protein AB2L07_00425 [Thermoanaerobaculaceae bacterium]